MSEGLAFEVDYLVDRRDRVADIASALWRQWGYRSIDACAVDLARASRDALPVYLVAVADGRAVGVVGLIACNLPPRCDLTPWLAGLYVWPEHRGRGIGTALVRSLEATGARLGLRRLYLYTESAERFYERLGWRRVDRDRWEGDDIAIMTRGLRGSVTPP